MFRNSKEYIKEFEEKFPILKIEEKGDFRTNKGEYYNTKEIILNDKIVAFLLEREKEIVEMVKGIEEFNESYCERDEALLGVIKNEILEKLGNE